MYFVSLSSCMVIKLSPKFQFTHNVSNKLHLGQQIQGNETNSSMGHHSVIFIELDLSRWVQTKVNPLFMNE